MRANQRLILQRNLLKWYDEHQRDLPWRNTTDPYPVWISEVMLQQTQVQTVIPYYLKFLEHFPSIAALAQADTDALAALMGRARILLAGQKSAESSPDYRRAIRRTISPKLRGCSRAPWNRPLHGSRDCQHCVWPALCCP